MNERRVIPFWDLAVVAGGLALIIGPFLPWISAASGLGALTRNGIDYVGAEAFVLVVAGALLAYMGYTRIATAAATPEQRSGGWWPVIVAAVGGALTAYYFVQVQDRVGSADSEFVVASIGIGLWLCVAGAVAGLIGGFLGRRIYV